MSHRHLIIDVSRLVGRFMKGRLPTGIDRVILAYISNYSDRAQAFIRDGRFHVVLNKKLSQTLFHLLNNPPDNFKAHAWRLIAQGTAAVIKQRSFSGSFFFNISHAGLEYHRYPELLAKLKVRPVFMVHDLIPIDYPEFCRQGEKDKHILRMKAVLEMAGGIVTNSQKTLDQLAFFAETQNLDMPPSVAAWLAPPAFSSPQSSSPVKRPYFVALGTIEPRKNHLLLLQVWKRLIEQSGEEAPLLVLIGQRGWECENVVDLLERCSGLRDHVIEISSCSDTELSTWLHYAQALLFPSFAEGFGLPLVEAFSCGTPVIASDLEVFREIGGDVPEYCDPLDGVGWLRLIQEYTADSYLRKAQIERIASYKVPSWSEHFVKVDSLLKTVDC